MQNLHSPVRLRSAPPGSLLRATISGAASGLALGCLDFCGSLAWVNDPRDLARLAFGLAALLTSSGALIGTALALIARAAAPSLTLVARRLGGADVGRTERWNERLAPAPLVLALSPGLACVAILLFRGARASSLPLKPLLTVAAALLLLAMTWAIVGAATRLARRAASSRGLAIGVALSASLVGAALWVASRRLYPGLYEYLHGLLCVTAWGAFAFAVWLVAFARSPRGPERARASLSAAAACIGLVVAIGTARAEPVVRAALYDVRIPVSHTLALALGPLGSSGGVSAAAVARARRARAERTRAFAAGDLPRWEGAHVLLVTVDALRADHLGLYGYRRHTSPFLDELANDAVVLEHAYAQAPHSSYSLSTIMTGDYIHEQVELEHPLPADTLPTLLTAAGYDTSAIFTDGIFHTEGERVARYREDGFGFTRWEPSAEDADDLTTRAIAEIDRVVRSGEPTSFLWVHYFDAHEPYRATAFGTSDVDRYDSEILSVDASIRRLVAAARERYARELVLVVSADHGEEFREHGGVYHGTSLYEEQIRVPLLVLAPGLTPRRVATPVELVDLAPTILAMLGVRPGPAMRGDDLRGLLTGRIDQVGPVFAGQASRRMVISWPRKLIYDLRFGVTQLYDLERDPRERVNLASRDPESVDALRGEIHAWLDSLAEPVGEPAPEDAMELALARGRVGDRRALAPLSELVTDRSRDAATRREAAELLGRIGDRRARDPLAQALEGCGPLATCTEIAAALGLLGDERARGPLVAALDSVHDTEPRVRVALALGRLDDRAAVPALIEAMRDAATHPERREAVRALGRIGDRRAVDPLLELLDDFRLRRYAAVSLGQIGDRRALEPLIDHLRSEDHEAIKDGLVRGLGELGDPRAIPVLVRVASEDATVQYATESLLVLHALSTGSVGGVDFGPTAPIVDGFDTCVAKEPDDWHYIGRTTCTTNAGRVTARLIVPYALRAHGATAIVRARRADAATVAHARVSIGGALLGRIAVDGQWAEIRLDVPAEALSSDEGLLTIEIDPPEARLEIDHIVLVPGRSSVARRGT